MNIFSEIYGTYFRIAAKLLENEVTDEKNVRALLDSDHSDEVKVAMLQALAWFTHSVNRQPIIDVCRQLMNDDQVSALVRTNALRTYNRLK